MGNDFRNFSLSIDNAPDFCGHFIEVDNLTGVDFNQNRLTLDDPPGDSFIFDNDGIESKHMILLFRDT
jgi:hypothetical protein